MRSVNEDLPKPMVTHVPEDSLARKVGLKRGDLIIALSTGLDMYDSNIYDARMMILNWNSLLNLAPKTLQKVTLKVRRGGIQIDIEYPRSEFDAELMTLKAKLN